MKFIIAALLAFGALTGRAIEAAVTLLPELRFGSVTAYSENDKYFSGTDQHYTNGFKISFLSTALSSFTDDPVPRVIQNLARALERLLPTGRDYKLGLSLGQSIFTPNDISATAYLPNDRPYAAWLYGGTTFQIYQAPRVIIPGWRAMAQLDAIEITAGLVGPGALGRQIQNGFHDLIGIGHANGWSNQIHNEPGLNLGAERKYRWSTLNARDGWGADLIPHAGLSLGNISTYANAGCEIRAGWRLPADFGTNLIRPSGDSNTQRRPDWSLFGFAAFDARLIARDITLDGNTFRASPRVSRRSVVDDRVGGFAVGTRHWQLTYSQAVRSREYHGQPKVSVFGSISATFYY